MQYTVSESENTGTDSNAFNSAGVVLSTPFIVVAYYKKDSSWCEYFRKFIFRFKEHS